MGNYCCFGHEQEPLQLPPRPSHPYDPPRPYNEIWPPQQPLRSLRQQLHWPQLDELPGASPGASPGEDLELAAATRMKDFTFDGQNFDAKVIDVYDGDTIRIIFRLDGKLVQFVARMAGYDSPEMKPLKSNPNRDAEKAAAIIAKNALSGRIINKVVQVYCGTFDKYRRILVTIFINGENINEWMLKNKFGYPYQGGTKVPFSE